MSRTPHRMGLSPPKRPGPALFGAIDSPFTRSGSDFIPLVRLMKTSQTLTVILRLLLVNWIILGLVGAVPAFASAEQEGGQKGGSPDALREPSPRLPAGRPRAVAQARSNTRQLYIATETGLFVSGDGGGRWDPLEASLPGNDVILALAIDPLHEGQLYAGGRGRLWQSPDGGATWIPFSSPSEDLSALRSIAGRKGEAR